MARRWVAWTRSGTPRGGRGGEAAERNRFGAARRAGRGTRSVGSGSCRPTERKDEIGELVSDVSKQQPVTRYEARSAAMAIRHGDFSACHPKTHRAEQGGESKGRCECIRGTLSRHANIADSLIGP